MLGKHILTLKLLQVCVPRPESGLPCQVVQTAHCSRSQKRQEGAVQDTPQVSRCALEQVAFLVYIRTLELSEGESEVRGAP